MTNMAARSEHDSPHLRPHTLDAPPSAAPRLAQHSRGSGSALGYLLLGFPLALIAFVGAITLFSVGVSTVIIWIGLPILVGAALYARGFATVERRLQSRLLGRTAPAPAYLVSNAPGPRRFLAPLRDPQTWLDLVWTLVHFIISTVTFSIALTWVVGAACTVLAPISVFVLSTVLSPEQYTIPLATIGLTDSVAAEALAESAVGLLFLLTLPWVVRGLAAAQAGVAYALLSLRAETQRELGSLRTSRDAGRQAETDQLRRLERDIHDGPQQRLVRLNMDLARARRMAATDPENAQQILAGAMEQTQATLNELRMLSRGIAPPLLVDRGLAAAITEAAGRSTVPVTVDVDVPRLPTHLENTAYYVASEALANLNKHSLARQARIVGRLEGDHLVIAVTDDGVGGADPAKGHGLAGLAERLRSVEGQLTVESPPGGPTVVKAVIPCRS